MKSKVFFSKNITSDEVIKLYSLLGVNLKGNIAIKLHSGEKGNQNFLPPTFFENFINKVGGTVVECNTAYPGSRNTTKKHLKTMDEHGWSKYFNVDIMDADNKKVTIDIPNGKIIKKNYIGSHLSNYDSMIVLSHFKGHPCAGFGGALKQLSIGCASSYGKAYIHSAGKTTSQKLCWLKMADDTTFQEAMADAASSIHNMFKGQIIYINVMKNMSVDCDCCAVAEDPCMKDIGILASLDPIAIDKACLDLVNASDDPGKDHLNERIDSHNGRHIIDASEALGFGNKEYELINID